MSQNSHQELWRMNQLRKYGKIVGFTVSHDQHENICCNAKNGVTKQ